jgi:hypothetical protein
MAEIKGRLETTKDNISATSPNRKILKDLMNIYLIQNITTIPDSIVILRKPTLKSL